jgi:hypothetical protein
VYRDPRTDIPLKIATIVWQPKSAQVRVLASLKGDWRGLMEGACMFGNVNAVQSGHGSFPFENSTRAAGARGFPSLKAC